MSYSGQSKIAFCRRLGNDWQDLATCLDIPAPRRNQFPQGRECHAILEWLEEDDKRLQKLSEALRVLERDDLLSVLELSQSISHEEVMQEKTTSASTPDNQIDKQRLITLLLDCPSLRDTGTRSSLLKMLPHHIVDHIKVGNTIKEYVINIVDGCMDFADGLQHLFAAIRFFDEKTIQFQALIGEFNLDKDKNETPPPVIGDIEKTITALMAQLHLSPQMRACDEFTQHNQDSLQLIREAMVQLKQLSPQTPEYGRVSLSVGSALASTGELLQAERLFTQIIENTDKKPERAIAYFNLFQVQLRREVYPEALENLQAAIAINPHYALHDLQKYPLERLLGAGGMGCVFLCQNHNHSNRLLAQHERVVVKCFWEHPKARLDEVFKEPFAMRDIAGDYIPEPLDIGYADTIKRERAYFVTAYIDDAIDGEAWLEKYGPLDLETGLQVGLQIANGLQIAHAAGICHLDLKPANILLNQTNNEIAVKIIDFGLSQVVPSLQQKAMTMQQSRAGLSQFGQAIFGTLDYACPEQQGFSQYGKPGVLCDVFAFGMTMSRFFTGKNPRYVRERDLPKVEALRDLLGDCVEQEPKQRPDSAKQLLNDLKVIKGPDKTEQRQKDEFPQHQIEEGREQQEKKQTYLNDQTFFQKYIQITKKWLQISRYDKRTILQIKKQEAKFQEIGISVKQIVIIISLALIGLISVLITSISSTIFDLLNLSLLPDQYKYVYQPNIYEPNPVRVIDLIISILLSILLIGQYLWRHRQTISHIAMIIGLICIALELYFILACFLGGLGLIFGKAFNAGKETLGAIVSIFLPLSLLGQYLLRYRQTIPYSAMVTGLIAISFGIYLIPLVTLTSLGYGEINGAIYGILLAILFLGQYLWMNRQTIPYIAMIIGLIFIGFGVFFIPMTIFFLCVTFRKVHKHSYGYLVVYIIGGAISLET